MHMHIYLYIHTYKTTRTHKHTHVYTQTCVVGRHSLDEMEVMLYVCMYIHAYVLITGISYIYICTRIYGCLPECMYVYVLLASLANVMKLCVVGRHSLDEMEVKCYTCVCVYTCIYIQVNSRHTFTGRDGDNIYIYIYMYVCMYVCMYVYIYTYIQVCSRQTFTG